jgi:hypothetical protein
MAEATIKTQTETEIPLTIDEFCTSLSIADRRVEMIGAFNSVEKQAGRVKDTRSAFKNRFQAFINAPA